jgi:hypothetical protein
VYVGNVYLPAIDRFKPGNVSKPVENIYPLGTRGTVLAEFEPDLAQLEMSGNLLQTYGGSRTIEQLKEDAEAIAQRRAGYNYVHNVKGRSGFISCSNVDVDFETGVLWPVSVDGQWLDKGDYVMQLSVNPVTRANDWDIEGTYKMRIPSGYSADAGVSYGYNYIDTEDGNIQEINTAEIKSVNVEISGDDTTDSKCKCYDGSSPVYSTSHIFTGQCSISNGLYKIIFDSLFLYLRYWDGSAWQILGTLSHHDDGTITLNEINNDRIIIKKGQTIEIEMEYCRVPRISSSGELNVSGATNGSTSSDNYLPIGTNKYVASTIDFSISSTVISATDMWFFYAASDVSNEAHNAIVKSNLKRSVIPR